MYELLTEYARNPVFWGVLGVVIACFEMLVPGVYLLWLGLGSLLTSLVLYFFPDLHLTWILITFCCASILFMILGSVTYHKYLWHSAGDESLNQRGKALVGQTFVLDDPITHGKGRVRIGDSYWVVRGKDAKAGASITIEGVEGNTLLVRVLD